MAVYTNRETLGQNTAKMQPLRQMLKNHIITKKKTQVQA